MRKLFQNPKRINFNVDAELYTEFDAIAQKKQLNISLLLRNFVTEFVEKNK